jgi:hypothetical protein
MKKYQVIIILDESRNKSYYQRYIESEDATLGNITVEELPPYADINMARACYWDADNKKWIYDEDKEAEIQAKITAAKEAAEKAQAAAEATPSNADLADCVVELGDGQSSLEDAVAELGELVNELSKRVTKLEGGEA